MSWNYRVVKQDDHGTPLYGIYEVYYNDVGKANGVTESPIRIYEESVDDLKKTLILIEEALTKEVLIYEEI